MEWSSDKHDRAREIWQALGGMYGSQLIREYGEEVPDIWKQAIHRLTDRQVRRGLAALGNQGGTRPPTLPAFVLACKTITATEAASLNPRLPPPDYDIFHREGQLGLLTFLRQQGGVSTEALRKLIQAKNTIVEHCRLLDEAKDPEGLRLPVHLKKRLTDVMAEL